MEEYDDLSEGPNKDGKLNLSYNNWDEMPHELFELYRSQLLGLSLSHNRILQVSNQIGKLTLMRELDLSHNQIEKIDPAIGNLLRLRKLNLSNNALTALPTELCNCQMMDTLVLNDNKLTCIPDLEMPGLETLDLRNNYLQRLPNLTSIECLKAIPCNGNKALSMIHYDMQSDSDLVLWTLRLHETNKKNIEMKMNEYREMEKIAKQTELAKLDLNEEVAKLEEMVGLLRKDRPLIYIEMKDKVCRFMDSFKSRLVKKWITLRKRVSILRLHRGRKVELLNDIEE